MPGAADAADRARRRMWRATSALFVAAGAVAGVAVQVVTEMPAAAATFTVAAGFASYAPAADGLVPTTWDVNDLVSGGTPDDTTLQIVSQPASGTAVANTSGTGYNGAGTITYTPTSTTTGVQIVTFKICESGAPTTCGQNTLTLSPPTLASGPGDTQTVFSCPVIGGTSTRNIGIALSGPASVQYNAQFATLQAAEPQAIPSSQSCNGTNATVNYVDMIVTIVPVPINATYVPGTMALVGGDLVTRAATGLTYCNGSTVVAHIGAGSGTCDASTGTANSFPSGPSYPCWQTYSVSGCTVSTTSGANYFEVYISGHQWTPGNQITAPTVSAAFTASGNAGTTIQPELTEFRSEANATAFGFNTTSKVYAAPTPTLQPLATTTITQANQAITFTSTPPSNAQVGGPTYTVTATGGASGNPVTFSIDPSASSVCTIAGAIVSFQATGTCVIDANQAGNANYLAAPQVQQSFAVGQGTQTITFTSSPPSNAAVGGPTYTVTATGGASGNPVVFTIDASATSVCSISGSTVSFIGAGTCVIDANQAGNANYLAAPQVQQSFAVGQGSQTISFTSSPPSNAVVGGPTYTVSATASSGLPVTLSIDASAASVCSLSGSASGSTVTFVAAGTCVIDANQAGNANYNAAPQVQQSFAVGKGSQTISFTSSPPSNPVAGGPTYTVSATASSGLPVTMSIDASATSVCSISGSTVSFIGAGTCVIDANQAGNANYLAAPQVQQSFAVGQGTQTITFTSSPPSNAAVGGPTYTVSATGGASGNPVVFTIDASATSVCSISGSTVSFIGAGTCVIDANQAGNANYLAAPQVQQSFAVGKGSQTISFTSSPPSNPVAGGPTYTVTATASSGLPVTLSIDASATSVCSLSGSASGSTVTFVAAGTCVIDANQAGNANYNAAPQVQQSFAVGSSGKAAQSITFTSSPPSNAVVGGPTYTVTATASSGLPVTLSIDASATSVCSLSGSASGSTVSFMAGGTCVIDANQAGDATYNPAAQVQQSFAVSFLPQAITFTSSPPVNATYAGPTYTVTATGGASGNPVVLTIDASATSVCSLSGSASGSTVSFIGAGTCVIDANQAGNSVYSAAPQSQQSFSVAKAAQAITFTSSPPVNATYAGPTYTVTATGGASGNPVVLTIDASATSVCSISGSTVSFIGAGTCVIDANQAGNADYLAAAQVQQSFSVAKATQAITVTSTAPTSATAGGPTYTVTATGGASGNPVVFTIDASATSVCSISGSTVSFIGAGTCVIDANQAGNADYLAAAQVQQSFSVAKGSQSVVFTSSPPANAEVGTTYDVTATASSGLPVALSIDASATSVCSISGSTVSFVGVGTCVIDANQAGNSSWFPASQVQQQVTVSPGLPGAPTIGTALGGNNQATVSWTVPANDGAPLSAFVITPFAGGVAQTPVTIAAGAVGSPLDPTPGAADSYTLTSSNSSITNGVTYTFTVAAVNGVGTGPASAPSNAVATSTVPGAPTGVTAVSSMPNQVTLSWVAPGNTGGIPLTGYVITVNPGNTTVNVGNPGQTTVVVTQLTNGTTYTFTVAAANADGLGPASAPVSATPRQPGYWLVAADGGIFAYGVPFYGSMGGHRLNAPMVGMAATPDGKGYWTVAADGGVFAFGDATFYGSMGGVRLNKPVVAMAATPDGKGYWLVAADGGIFAFGDARFWGSTGSLHLVAPVTGMAPTSDGRGYWLTASDGGIFAFGDAAYDGSANQWLPPMPIVGMAGTPDGKGYWQVGADGSVYSFGDAGYHGSMARIPLNAFVVDMVGTADGKGYWLVGADGGVFAFGDAPSLGSAANLRLVQPIVGMAVPAS